MKIPILWICKMHTELESFLGQTGNWALVLLYSPSTSKLTSTEQMLKWLRLFEIGTSFDFRKSWLIGIIWWKLQEIGIAKFLAFSYCDMTRVLNWQSHMTFVWQYVSFSQSTIYFLDTVQDFLIKLSIYPSIRNRHFFTIELYNNKDSDI